MGILLGDYLYIVRVFTFSEIRIIHPSSRRQGTDGGCFVQSMSGRVSATAWSCTVASALRERVSYDFQEMPLCHVPCLVDALVHRLCLISSRSSLIPRVILYPFRKKKNCTNSLTPIYNDRMHPHVRPDSTPSWRSTTSSLSRSMRGRRSTPRPFRAGKESTPRPHTRCTPK